MIWFVAAQVYLGVPFTRYTILGDDIVIGDERVAERYHELMSQLNVPFSLEHIKGVLGSSLLLTRVCWAKGRLNCHQKITLTD